MKEGKDNPSGDKSSPSGSEAIGLEDLKKAQYTYGIPGQANRYTKSTKSIAEYAKIAYGKEMWRLVLEGTETTFDEPTDPGKDASRSEMKKYEMRLSRWMDEEDRYKRNKARVFGIVMGKCHAAMKNKVESLPEFDKLEQDDDVIGLLAKMKELAFSTGSTQYESWTQQAQMRKMINLRQDPKESLNNFSKRFLAQQEVTEEVWGKLIPSKLKGKSTKDQEEGGQKFLACLFLAGVDRERYKKAINDLNNDFVQGTNSYPEDVPGMLALLNNRREGGGKSRVFEDERDGRQTSFAQLEGRRCFQCGKKGHIKRDCPELNETDDDDGSIETTQSSTDQSTASRQSRQSSRRNRRSRMQGAQVPWSG